MERDLTKSEFELLLSWIHPEEIKRNEEFQAIRRSLDYFFFVRNCFDSEALADETIERVARRVSDISEGYSGNPRRYFYGVAKNVYREYLRDKERNSIVDLDCEVVADPIPSWDSSSDYLDCLRGCLNSLANEDRSLILDYYDSLSKNNPKYREELARKYAITLNALRVRIFRIKKNLSSCAENCSKSLKK